MNDTHCDRLCLSLEKIQDELSTMNERLDSMNQTLESLTTTLENITGTLAGHSFIKVKVLQ
jgi:prefoldin subunit 5